MNIVLVDDDALVCASLKTILEAGGEVRVAATGGSGAEAVALYRAHRPDVLLMDIRMAGMTGLEAGESLLREFPDARILFLTTFSDDEYIVRALRMGAKGYLIKQDFESILPALRAVHAGQSVFGGEVMGRLPGLMQSGGGFDYAARGLRGSGTSSSWWPRGAATRRLPTRCSSARERCATISAGSSTSSNCGIAPSSRCFITTTRPKQTEKRPSAQRRADGRFYSPVTPGAFTFSSA